MAKPKKSQASDPDFKSEDVLHSEHTFTRPLPTLCVIEDFLSRNHHSGKLEVDFNKGGKTNVRFHQKQAVDIIP
jgi:hypothetical protein